MARQLDLFLEPIYGAPLKDDRVLMEFPFFSLSKTPRMEPMIYDRGDVRIEVRPGQRGIATIWDKDVLIYLTSLLNDRLERGRPEHHPAPDRVIHFNVHDLLRMTGRGTGKQAYRLLDDAMFRLRSTTIVTTVRSGSGSNIGEKFSQERQGFGWIAAYRTILRQDRLGRQIMTHAEVDLNDWTWRAVVQERRILTLHPDYFNLTGGLERRCYELARKHCGRQPQWTISLPNLIEKSGSVLEARFFKRELRTLCERDRLPEYQMTMLYDPMQRSQAAANGLDTRRWASNDRILVRFTRR